MSATSGWWSPNVPERLAPPAVQQYIAGLRLSYETVYAPTGSQFFATVGGVKYRVTIGGIPGHAREFLVSASR